MSVREYAIRVEDNIEASWCRVEVRSMDAELLYAVEIVADEPGLATRKALQQTAQHLAWRTRMTF